ncbi:P-loop containing nucleoside triphosphate hydrolase protein [Hypoxylon rubiginosum]|uniref:P-loop containing nucleoside triphosphate hydrolase protein n=1 Tax=Hypoxylon rubiginosum TaxID=110542 RepID=A0ACC0DMQ2_9PEZI|nr:P-loop containing nucleoside triphosphate hydrolase protein [Hypoxylon rubiginosum]
MSSLSNSKYSSESSFARIPPGGRLILDERSHKQPFKFLPKRFKGREARYFQPMDKELEIIQSALFPPPDDQGDSPAPAHQVLSVTGLGGVGKTELVYRYMTSFKDQFDAIFFVTAESESRIRRQYRSISVELGLVDASDRENLELCSEAFKLWLSNPVIGIPETRKANAKLQWLLVFDDVRDPDVLENYWPAGNSGKIITTTRNTLSSHRVQIPDRLQLYGLEIPDAVQLLKSFARDETQGDAELEKDAAIIAEWVEGFPLALEQLGNIIYSEYLTISQFRMAYPKKSDLFKRLYDGYNGKSLVTAWALEEIQERNQEVFLAQCLISVLDPEQIESRMLVPSDTNGSSTISSQCISIRKELADSSLIEIDRKTANVRTCRLVQEVTKDLIVRQGLASSIFKTAMNRVVDHLPSSDLNIVGGRAAKSDLWKACYPHILHLKVVYEEFVQLGMPSLECLNIAELLLKAS